MVSSLYLRYRARRKSANIGATSRSLTTPTGMAAKRHAKRHEVSPADTGDKVILSIRRMMDWCPCCDDGTYHTFEDYFVSCTVPARLIKVYVSTNWVKWNVCVSCALKHKLVDTDELLRHIW